MRPYLIFVTVALGLLMYSIDTTVVAVAFPSFIRDFHTSVLWAAWTISIYLIAVALAMPLMGKLSDSFGHKRIFLFSLMLFTGSSLACGLSPNIYSLILFRFLQGVGGAAFLPTASGIVSDQFPGNRERAIGLFTSIFPIGGIIGPNIGGWIVSNYSWRFIFYVNLPTGMVLIVLTLLLLKGSRISSQPRIDYRGAALMGTGVIFLMFGLNLVSESFSAGYLFIAVASVFLSITMLLLFFYHEKKEVDPFLDIALLRSVPFLAANLLNVIIGAAVFAVFAFVPLYATTVHGLSTLMSGIILTPRSFGMIPASAVTAIFLTRWGYRRPIVLGLAAIAVSTILIVESQHLPTIISARLGVAGMLSFILLLTGIGVGIALPAANNACIELMPHRVATIVGLRGMFRTIGGALGISQITIVLHLSSNFATGFRIVFTFFGLILLFAIPLAFLMPTGRRATT